MGYTNKTSHYNLPQWIAGDKPSWLGDVNTAMLNIDTAIAGADASASAAKSSAAAANAQVQSQEPKITKNTTDIQALTENLADTQGEVNNVKTTAEGALPKSGGTMTGDLILNTAPTSDLQAATKKYVDDSAVIAATNFELYTENLGFTSDATSYRYNKALICITLGGGVMADSFTNTIAVGSGTFVPILKAPKNLLNLPVKTPTTLADLTALHGYYTTTKNGQAVNYGCKCYFDGENTIVGFAGATSAITNFQGATLTGIIVDIL